MSDRVLYPSCPLCESRDMADVAVGDCSNHPLYDQALDPKIRWRQCGDCSHIFTAGYFTDAAAKIVFGRTNAGQKVDGSLEQHRAVSARMVEKVLPYMASGAWLDVGFGNGSLLFTAQEYGFRPIGTDLRIENVEAMNALGIDAYRADLTTLALPEACSVISMADVLEHVAFPKPTLVAANRLLTDKGVVLISMPNTESMIWKILTGQNQNPYWDELEHYHNFSRTRLYALLKDCGFDPVRYGVSERYRACMEIVAVKRKPVGS